MSRRTLAVALTLCTFAVPASASSPPVPSGTWIPTAATAVLWSEVAAFASGTGYATTGVTHDANGYHTSLLTTTDHGRSWSLDTDALPNGDVAFSTETDWWANSRAGGLEHTTNAGATWSAVSLPLAADEYAVGIPRLAAGGGGMAFSSPIATSSTGCPTHDALFFTGDGGTTWQRHDFPTYASGGGEVYSLDVASDDTAVAVLFNDVTCESAATTMDVYVTTDAGATWARVVASPATGPQVFDATISPDGSTVVVGYNDGTVKWSTNGGTTFTSSALRYPLLDALPGNLTGAHDAVIDVELAGGTGYAVLNGGSIHRTTDGGATWSVDGVHGVFAFTALAAFDARTAFTASPGLVATRI